MESSTFSSSLRTVVRYRWLLYELVVRDLTLRYRGSFLGFLWTLLNPVLFMLVYTLVFSVYLPSNLAHFPLYLLSGMIPWMWISGAIGQGVTSIIDGRAYVGKTLLPTELLILVPVLSNGINFLITIVLLFPVSIFVGVNPMWAVLFLPLLIAIQFCMTLGITFLVATCNVFYRDLQQLVGYFIMAFMFLTPMFYEASRVPANLQFIVNYSPLAALISGYQHVFYYGTPPEWKHLLFAGVFAVVILAIGLAYFNRNRDAFGEYV